jgi:hypothetical protein
MHGPLNFKFVNAQQAKQIYQYRNAKEKLYKTIAAIWYNKMCREKQLAPSSILTSLADSNVTGMTNNYCCEHSVKSPDDGQ